MDTLKREISELANLIEREREDIEYLEEKLNEEFIGKNIDSDIGINKRNTLQNLQRSLELLDEIDRESKQIIDHLNSDNLMEAIDKIKSLKGKKPPIGDKIREIGENTDEPKVSNAIKELIAIENKIDNIEVDITSNKKKLSDLAEKELSSRPKIMIHKQALLDFMVQVSIETENDKGREASGLFEYERVEGGLLLHKFNAIPNDAEDAGRANIGEEGIQKLKQNPEKRVILGHSHPSLYGREGSHSKGDLYTFEGTKNKIGVLACINSPKKVVLAAQVVSWPQDDKINYNNLRVEFVEEIEDKREEVSEHIIRRAKEMYKSALENESNYNEAIIKALIAVDEKYWSSYLEQGSKEL